MLSKEELREINLNFWIEFKKYMSRTKSSGGKKINWLSYPTQIKHIHLRFVTSKTEVALCFDIQYKDETIRAVFWEQLNELKKVLTDAMEVEGEWFEHFSTEAIPDFCRIQWRLEQVNYLNKVDHEQIFAFFKTRICAFDRFYQDYKEILLFLAK